MRSLLALGPRRKPEIEAALEVLVDGYEWSEVRTGRSVEDVGSLSLDLLAKECEPSAEYGQNGRMI